MNKVLKSTIMLFGAIPYLLLIIDGCHAQSDSIYYVWAPDSALVYQEPSLNSPTVAHLAYGTEVHVSAVEETSSQPFIRSGYKGFEDTTLYASWVQISISGKQGYILSNRVSQMRPMKKSNSNFEGIKEYWKREFGVMEVSSFKKPVVYNGNTFYEIVDSTSFQGGLSHSVKLFDGCFRESYYFSKISLKDVYLLFLTTTYSTYTGYNPIEDKIEYYESFIDLEGVSGGKYLFIDTYLYSKNGIVIEQVNDNLVRLSYYHCT